MHYWYGKWLYCLMQCCSIKICILDRFQGFYCYPSKFSGYTRDPMNGIITSKTVNLSIVNAHYLLYFIGAVIFIFMMTIPKLIFQPNFWYSVLVGTGSSILYLYLILLLSCVKIWNYPIITTNKNYLCIWCFLS